MKNKDYYFQSLDNIDFSVCEACGLCCKIEGYVFVNEQELEKIADYLNIDVYEFSEKYCKLVNRNKLSLINKENTNECVFLGSDSNCEIYEVRPNQCRTYPLYKRVKDLPEACKLK